MPARLENVVRVTPLGVRLLSTPPDGGLFICVVVKANSGQGSGG